ncbi:MAG: thioredoxin-disulfide reductase [Geothrix sp.]|uniref:thioredoxin-disulfide reductase n=1 Tax=Geothrix sp. TaxID=1962974 RepID=UPI0017A0288C|nr:thioredoxin-disulfide reductase [Geothrix sp.]NWJ42503.1 thioredoxin-disulfide reductase [Geothrix sp.]WIL19535.1 MAG: thioredoxin-disulfide reductase [Geothrix sp.]
MARSHHRLIIIGTGPAGYTAAIYASRARLAPLVLEGVQPGGQLTITTEVENYPGFSHGIPGPVLMAEMREQALRFGTKVRAESVETVDLSVRPFLLVTDQGSYTSDALIIATGASAKWLGLGKDLELSRNGGGVSACATCDGFFFRGKEIAVVGGGDTALEEAIYLTKFASKVHLIHRRDAFRASKAMQLRALTHKKIQVHWNREISCLQTVSSEDAFGEKVEKLASLILKDTQNGRPSCSLPVNGLFVAIGHQPNTRLFEGQVPMDASGYLLVEKGSSRTSIAGVFAAGDVADHTYRQAITAAGSGCMAAIDAERWLAEQTH